MVCSTAAQSCVKVTCSMELEPSLQMSCLQVINKYPQLRKRYYAIPGLHKLLKKQYFWLIRPENEGKLLSNIFSYYRSIIYNSQMFRTKMYLQ